MGIGRYLSSECRRIIELGKYHELEVTKVSVEGIYAEEIFEFSYAPKEENSEEVRPST